MHHTDIDEQHLDLILIDGLCVTCHAIVRDIHRRDTENRFRFASQQSPIGQRLIDAYGLRGVAEQSVMYLARGRVYTYSTAVLEIYAHLPGTSRVVRYLRLIPRRLRDVVYRLYARNRHRLFGRLASCDIPDGLLRRKFLDS